MNDQEQRWARVETAITARMAQLTLSQADLVRASGLSAETIRPIRTGVPGNYRPATLARLAKALLWPHDAVDKILSGADWRSFDRRVERTHRPLELSWLARYARTGQGMTPDAAAAEASVPLEAWAAIERGEYSDVALRHLDAVRNWVDPDDAHDFAEWPPANDGDDEFITALESDQNFEEAAQAIIENFPAAFFGKFSQLTPEQRVKLEAYLDGLLEGGR